LMCSAKSLSTAVTPATLATAIRYPVALLLREGIASIVCQRDTRISELNKGALYDGKIIDRIS
jgi:hypothetical protein